MRTPTPHLSRGFSTASVDVSRLSAAVDSRPPRAGRLSRSGFIHVADRSVPRTMPSPRRTTASAAMLFAKALEHDRGGPIGSTVLDRHEPPLALADTEP